MSFVALLIQLTALSTEYANEGEASEGMDETLRQTLLAASQGTPQTGEHPALCTFSWLPNEQHQLHLRVTVLGQAGLLFLPPLLDTLTVHAPITLGTGQYRIVAIDLSHSAWAGLSTWADFLAPAYGHTITLHLGTPLVLRSDTPAVVGRTFSFPTPRLLFAALAHQWQTLGGPPLPTEDEALLHALEDGSIVLADYHLRSVPVLLDGKAQRGFDGWICYECRRSASALQATLTALARFAFFTGIGIGTERGMGTTRIILR